MTRSGSAFSSLLDRRLIVCVGPGGVGKTTLAAAIGLCAARTGRRTAVITVDPAKRLADALGLDGLSDELLPVRTAAGAGELYAAMLDTKASYDALIARITPEAEARSRILGNKVYQSFSRTLARSHAYVAMERLYHVLHDDRFDLVVLDTPPTRSALDILDAPSRLVSFLDEKVLRAFLGDDLHKGPAAWLAQKGRQTALRLFGELVGGGIVRELVGFFEVFIQLRQGFAHRAEAVRAQLRHRHTAFVLCTSLDRTHLADAEYLMHGLKARDIPLYAVLFNRAYHPGLDGTPLRPARTADEDATRRLLEHADSPALTQLVHRARTFRKQLADQNRQFSRSMAAFLPSRTRGLALPIVDRGPTDVASLLALLDAAHDSDLTHAAA